MCRWNYLRSPYTPTTSQISFAVASIVEHEELRLTLVRILKFVQFCLQRTGCVLAWNVPLFHMEIEVSLQDCPQHGDFNFYTKIVVSPSSQ